MNALVSVWDGQLGSVALAATYTKQPDVKPLRALGAITLVVSQPQVREPMLQSQVTKHMLFLYEWLAHDNEILGNTYGKARICGENE